MNTRVYCVALAVLAVGLLAIPTQAAQTVHLFLTSNGEAIEGESTVTSLGRENSIECLSFVESVSTAREARSGLPQGHRETSLQFTKRLDKATPLLMRSLANNEVIEGEFRFYRPNPAGDGTTQHFFTVEFGEGRIASIRRVSPDVIDPASATAPPTEEVAFYYNWISYTYESTGASFRYSPHGAEAMRTLVAPADEGGSQPTGGRLNLRLTPSRKAPKVVEPRRTD